MVRRIVLLILVLGTISTGFARVELISFSVYPVVNHSRLEWSTGQETNFRTFVVERSSDGEYWVPVGQVFAKGSFSFYEYSDSNPLDDGRDVVFFYRLKMVDNDGSFRISETREVSLRFSAVQHTWGSIKAMFR